MTRILWHMTLVALLTVPVMAATETRLDLVPYGGSVQYTGTAIKDSSTIVGL